MGWFLSFAVAATVAGQTVSDEQVAHWAAAKGGTKQALSFLVQGKWTELEAGERRLSVSETTARQAADPPSQGLTKQDATYEAKVLLLRTQIQDQITEPAARSVTPDQVKAYVDAHPKFLPEARTVRLVRTKTRKQAHAALRKLHQGATWKATQRAYAGGGTTNLTRNDARFPRSATKAIFQAQRNRTETTGTLVFEVTRIQPPRPMNRAQQEAQAWEILSSEAQARAIDAFNGAFNMKWRQRTTCAGEYAGQPECP